MVKYRLSTSGMSRSCSRVMSPAPAFSTLITSAPNHASSCVHVGPDCTCVKSRILIPSSALPIPNLLLVHDLVDVHGPSLGHPRALGGPRGLLLLGRVPRPGAHE